MFSCTSKMAYKVHHRSHIGLSSKTIKGASLPLESIHDIHGSDGLPLGVLCVGDGVPDDILQENLKIDKFKPVNLHNYLKNTPGLLVDKPTDPLDATPPCKSPDGRLSDTLRSSN